jgi:hypothetical protein
MRDAQMLLTGSSWQNAYMSAGLAIEFALKARIMHVERLNSWPSRRRRPELHTHSLGSLVDTAGLRPQLEQEFFSFSDIGLAWMVVKEFDINGRYPTGEPFPKRLACDCVEAIDGLGLLEWLITGIT